MTQYQESDGHPSAHGQFMNTEFYAQDNWRVKRNFTIDAGIRFYYITPTQSDGRHGRGVRAERLERRRRRRCSISRRPSTARARR